MLTEDKDTKYTKLVALYDILEPKYQGYILNSINYFLKMQDEEKGA